MVCFELANFAKMLLAGKIFSFRRVDDTLEKRGEGNSNKSYIYIYTTARFIGVTVTATGSGRPELDLVLFFFPRHFFLSFTMSTVLFAETWMSVHVLDSYSCCVPRHGFVSWSEIKGDLTKLNKVKATPERGIRKRASNVSFATGRSAVRWVGALSP